MGLVGSTTNKPRIDFQSAKVGSTVNTVGSTVNSFILLDDSLDKRSRDEGVPPTPPLSFPSSFKEEDKQDQNPNYPPFLQDQMEGFKKGKGKLRYTHARKKSAEQQKRELMDHCQKKGIPFKEEGER